MSLTAADHSRFFDLSPDMLCIAGFDGYFKELNPAWESTLGFTCAELKARPFIEFVHPDDRARTLVEAQQLTAGGKTIYFQNRYICKDSSIKWLLWNASAVAKEQLIYAVARDITIQEQTEQALQYHVDLEKLITTLSTQFINLSPDQIDQGINQALQTIGELIGVDRSYIFLFSPDGLKMDNTHEWCATGIGSHIQDSQGLSFNEFPWFAEQLTKHDFFYVPHVADLPVEAQSVREILQAQGIQSLINILMLHGDKLIGFLGFDSMRAEKTWGQEDIRLFKTIAEMLVNALERKKAEQREALAYEFGQQLTTLLNPDVLLTEIVNRLQQTFGYYHAHVYLFNKTFPVAANPHPAEPDLLVMREGTGEAGLEMKRRGHTIPLQTTRSLVARAARLFQPVVVNDVRQNPDHLPNPLLPDTLAEVALPLFLGQRLIGVLDVQHTLVDHFNAAEIRTLQIVASQLSIALSNALLFDENARRLADLKQAEAALQKINEELEARVDERTAELTRINDKLVHEIAERQQIEQALRRQTQELTRSNAELEQFAYVASHDLQEPLRMVTSYVQLLARRYQDQLDTDADEFIHFAVDGATRMQQLINDLLTYSRVGRRGQEFEPTNCQAVVNRVLHNLHAAIEETNAIVTCNSLPVVMADSLQLELLFQNLIGNAIKFRSQAAPQIHLSAHLDGTAHSAQEWVFAVRDNGIGIASEYAERIFIIFQRLHSRDEYPGTGIGLAVCKKIVERHNGRIWVESQTGQGATFYFTIPSMKVEP